MRHRGLRDGKHLTQTLARRVALGRDALEDSRRRASARAFAMRRKSSVERVMPVYI
jgi:hypothetical protein